jgi:hypothetical protein
MQAAADIPPPPERSFGKLLVWAAIIATLAASW